MKDTVICELEQASHKARKACAQWLSNCLEIGYKKEQLDALEAIWWQHHDFNGNLKLDSNTKTAT